MKRFFAILALAFDCGLFVAGIALILRILQLHGCLYDPVEYPY